MAVVARPREYFPWSIGLYPCGPLPMTCRILFFILITFLETSSGRPEGKGKREGAPKGEDVYEQCSGCHSIDTGEKKVGPSLKGLFKKQKLLDGRPATEKNIRLVIRRGVDGMPAFEAILSADQLDLLIAFLKRH
jgi:cytochrome c